MDLNKKIGRNEESPFRALTQYNSVFYLRPAEFVEMKKARLGH